jgi:glycine dehydrogenase subunit 1
MHPWVGAGPEDQRHILSELGLESIDELFASIPDGVCVDGLELPSARDEDWIRRALGEMASANLAMDSVPCFLGAGVYRHLQPSIVDAVLSRAEFFTSYTPYQPEISQGTLQVIFEFQTLISRLTGLDVANASLYDGATSLVEAVLFSHRVMRGKRDMVVIAETVHPMYRRVLDSYTQAAGIDVAVVAPNADGRLDPDSVREAAGDRACCVAIQSPNFLGIVEDLPQLAAAAHDGGALAVQVVTEAVSLGLLAGGGSFGFDVVCGEAQSFGVAPGFGGPHLGFFACGSKNLRQMPGRLAGETVDEHGNPAFCLTLSTREQHIRRAKATSNICTNQGLCLLMASVYLALLGRVGLRRLAELNLARAEYAKSRVRETPGLRLPLAAPGFNEFVVEVEGGAAAALERARQRGIIGGLDLAGYAEDLPECVLVCTTELTSREAIDELVAALAGDAS